MPLAWNEAGKNLFETGVSKGVLFVMDDNGDYQAGVAWNGLINITKSPSGAEPSAIYADNIKYLNLLSVEELEASIEAYTYPDEFGECDGSAELHAADSGVTIGQQGRKKFALCYRTEIGNDQNPELGYKLNIIYGCLAGPSERSHDSVNDSPEAMTMSWDITTTPVAVTGHKPTASLVIDSTKVDAGKLAAIETDLYSGAAPTKLLPNDIIAELAAI